MNLVQLSDGAPVEDSPFVDAAATSAAIHLLKPIHEGLALFAEFDASTRLNSKIVSTVLQAITACYLPRQALPILHDAFPAEMRATVATMAIMKAYRRSPAAVDKKASLLLKPFDPSADIDGPYLLGYLSVKSLWRTVSRAVPKLLSETDLFMMYLRSYFFDDAGLICALLEPCAHPRQKAERVVNRIAERVRRLDRVTVDNIEEFAASVESVRATATCANFVGTAGIGNTAAGVAAAAQLWEQLATSWDAVRHNTQRTAFAQIMHDTLVQRQFATVVRADVQLEVDVRSRALQVVFDDKPILVSSLENVVSSTDGVSSLAGRATLEVTFNMADFSRAAVVMRDGIPLAVIPLWIREASGALRDHILRHYGDQAEMAYHERLFRERLDEYFSRPESLSQPAIDRSEELALPLWKDVALRYAENYRAIDNCSELMTTTGLRGLGASSTLTRQLALMGLTLSTQVDTENLRNEFAKWGWELSCALTELDHLRTQYGFSLQIAEVEGTTLCSI